ncbi:CPBP family intramembrane metalloprotease [Candidatus Bathyarchaeota archaeon]|nr:MAG: CPBP family intramembrane metalloprotease [Candidatus Bathyarchaeota archaeon]
MVQPNSPSPQPEAQRSSWGLFLAFLAAGGGTVLVADNLSDVLGVVPPVFFGLAYYLMHRSSRLRRFSTITYAFFVFALVISVRHLVLDSSPVNGLLPSLNGLIVYQVIDTSVVLAPVILLVLANGGTLSSLFLQKGNLRLGLAIAVPVFLALLIVSFLIEQALAPSFGVQGVGLPFVLSLAPYLSIVALLNGPKEELLYRGLFVQRYDAFLPRRGTNLLSTIIFALSVVEQEYFAQLIGAVLVALVGGLLFVKLMRKTNSIIASGICEGASTIPIYLIVILTLVH